MSSVPSSSPDVSIVVPCFNEVEGVEELHRRLVAVLEPLVESFEILLVDDGSQDGTKEKISELCRVDKRVQGLVLSRNFGQHIAITAGLEHARGRATVVMDADLQDPPELLRAFWQAFENGADVVIAIRSTRRDPIRKRLFSWAFWTMINLVSEVPIPRNQSMMRLFSAKAKQALISMRENFRFIGGQSAWIGFHRELIPVETAERFAGETKYTFTRSLRLMWNAVTGFSTYPLRLIIGLGSTLAVIGFAAGMILMLLKILGTVDFLIGWASVIAVLTFLSGANIAVTGVVGLYVGKIYQQTMSRPLYFLQDHLNKLQ